MNISSWPQYTVLMEGVTVTAASGAGDLLEVRTVADILIVPLEVWVTTDDEETSQQVAIELADFATAGTGGTSVTPEPVNRHLQVSQTVCLRNNTVDATGTQNTHDRRGANLLGAGYEWHDNGRGIIVPINTSLVIGLASALAVDSILSVGIRFAEGGQ